MQATCSVNQCEHLLTFCPFIFELDISSFFSQDELTARSNSDGSCPPEFALVADVALCLLTGHEDCYPGSWAFWCVSSDEWYLRFELLLWNHSFSGTLGHCCSPLDAVKASVSCRLHVSTFSIFNWQSGMLKGIQKCKPRASCSDWEQSLLYMTGFSEWSF